MLEKLSPQLRGLTNHFRLILGVSKPHEIIEAWRPYNIKELAPEIQRPLLVLYGEAEYAQNNSEKIVMGILRFISELTCPAAIHEFTLNEGWAASHCQIGGLSPVQAVVFEWLDRTVEKKDRSRTTDSVHNWNGNVIRKYLHHPSEAMDKLLTSIRVSAI